MPLKHSSIKPPPNQNGYKPLNSRSCTTKKAPHTPFAVHDTNYEAIRECAKETKEVEQHLTKGAVTQRVCAVLVSFDANKKIRMQPSFAAT